MYVGCVVSCGSGVCISSCVSPWREGDVGVSMSEGGSICMVVWLGVLGDLSIDDVCAV